MIDGESVVFCNMSSWIMSAEYRAMKIGSKLLNPILDAKQLLITNLTPSAAHRKTYKKSGSKCSKRNRFRFRLFRASAPA